MGVKSDTGALGSSGVITDSLCAVLSGMAQLQCQI